MAAKGPTPKQHRIRLAVIPEPEPDSKRTVLNYDGEGTVVFRGPHEVRVIMECGSCSAPLTRGVTVSQLNDVVLRCKGCGVYNEVLAGT